MNKYGRTLIGKKQKKEKRSSSYTDVYLFFFTTRVYLFCNLQWALKSSFDSAAKL